MLLALLLIMPVVMTPQGDRFPVNVNVLWDMNADSDAITFYTFRYDAVAPVTVTSDKCVVATRTCSTPLTVNDNNEHTIAITATNQWGTSDPTTLTFRINNPKKVTNIRIVAP